MTTESAHILIVEDSITQAMLLQNVLEQNQFLVSRSANGRRALDFLRETKPMLVITDVQMPEMDGYELCSAIKTQPDLASIPVMLLTSLSDPNDILKGLECGADNFVVKPYDETFLLSRIHTILANQHIRSTMGPGEEIPIYFAGKRYVITSDRRQILNLLLSTYETAVQTNRDLIKAHEELKAAQAQLIEAEKMQSVGRLAAGVAHEVRNPLAILDMGIAFLSEKIADEDDKLVLKEMNEAVSRASSVVQRLMEMTSQRQLGMHEADMNALVAAALGIFRGELADAKIEVQRDFSTSLCNVRVDTVKIEQALLNIFANARDAMPDGGVLTVRTATRPIEAAETAFQSGDRSGARFRAGENAVRIEVEDTGSGIAPENLSKIFDPFFSTKPTGKGMGLGLTVARKIIELHGGKIEVRSRADSQPGTFVVLTFKCLAQADKSNPATAAS